MHAFFGRAITVGKIVAALAITAPALAGEASRNVALGEVSVADLRAQIDESDVRVIAESAIDRAVWPLLKRPSVVSVSLVSVERERVGEGSSLSCLVSATLRDKKTGNVYAIVESRARKEQKTVTRADERAAVSVALENAIGKLPSVVR